MFGNFSSITVCFYFALIFFPAGGRFQIVNIVAYGKDYLTGYQPFFHKLKNQHVCHFTYDQFRLFKITGTVQYLTGTDAVCFRFVGFDQIHGHRFVSPCMINQKFRVDAEYFIKKIFIIVITHTAQRASGNVSHRVKSYFFQLLPDSCAYPPEICQRPVIP